MISKIGETAGKVWQELGKNGQLPVSKLATALKQPEDHTLMAIGWLARENKVHLATKGKACLVCLTEDEKKKFTHHAKV